MEIFGRDFADKDDAVIIDAAIVFEVRYTDEEGDTVIETPTCCTNDSRVYQTGLFEWAQDVSQSSTSERHEPGGE